MRLNGFKKFEMSLRGETMVIEDVVDTSLSSFVDGYRPSVSDLPTLEEIVMNERTLEWLDEAFTWDRTTDGDSFWAEICRSYSDDFLDEVPQDIQQRIRSLYEQARR